MQGWHGSGARWVAAPGGSKAAGCGLYACSRPKTNRCLFRCRLSPSSPLLQYGNGSLRLTTRQTFQLHGVLKQNLKTVFSTVIKNMGSTLGACGDVNRNVMAPPALYKNRPEYT